MSEDKNKKQILDEFWDISSLVPEKRNIRPTAKSTSSVEIAYGEEVQRNSEASFSEGTLIKRYIPSPFGDVPQSKTMPTEEYIPEHSLIHRVRLYREKSDYDFYADFCADAKRMWSERGHECEYADFFSYSPQYNQLSREQLSYYLWWRQMLREGVFLRTNMSYINLLTYEIINSANDENAYELRETLISVFQNYRRVLGGLSSRYARWICDFSLLHRLTPPKNGSVMLMGAAATLKEYFVNIPGNTPEGWTETLLNYCCSYDYKTSKFATEENIALYDTHVRGALCEVIRALSRDGKILSGLPFGDCKIAGKAFDGALCASANRYSIEVKYCSFSRSHELRFLVGDAVKYTENKIRSHISVKSRLSVYTLPNELKEVIDAYFAAALPNVRRVAPKAERQEYDVLYDIPHKELSLKNAEQIELESWSVTRELVEAFDEAEQEESAIISVPQQREQEIKDGDSVFGGFTEALMSLKNGSADGLYALARAVGKPVEAVVDEINELAVEIIGDIIIEEADGKYLLIEDYADEIK